MSFLYLLGGGGSKLRESESYVLRWGEEIWFGIGWWSIRKVSPI